MSVSIELDETTLLIQKTQEKTQNLSCLTIIKMVAVMIILIIIVIVILTLGFVANMSMHHN
jgi:hypothetical protein